LGKEKGNRIAALEEKEKGTWVYRPHKKGSIVYHQPSRKERKEYGWRGGKEKPTLLAEKERGTAQFIQIEKEELSLPRSIGRGGE